MDETPGFWSTLHLYPADHVVAMPHPGELTDADDDGLRRWRIAVVEPVVASLLTVAECEGISVHEGVDGDAGDVWVCVRACGEEFRDMLVMGPWLAASPTDADVAERLADHLEDWIAESRFGWGQLRVAAYVL